MSTFVFILKMNNITGFFLKISRWKHMWNIILSFPWNFVQCFLYQEREINNCNESPFRRNSSRRSTCKVWMCESLSATIKMSLAVKNKTQGKIQSILSHILTNPYYHLYINYVQGFLNEYNKVHASLCCIWFSRCSRNMSQTRPKTCIGW